MAKPIDELLDQVRLLWHVATQVAERLHEGEPVTLGMRGVLEFLAREGPATVSGIARRRRVTRQHIQALVNVLLDQRLVVLDDNPAHRRSPLVGLTPEGQRAIDRMIGRERRFFDGLELKVKAGELRRAAVTLSAVSEALAGGGLRSVDR